MELCTPEVSTTVELDRLGDEIAERSAHLDAATARLLDLIREFDARAGWNTGFRSCAAWLTWRTGLSPCAAREHVRVARALGALPVLAQALAHGELSYSKVRELTRVVTPETEEELVAVGRAGTAEHVERIVRGWRRVDRQAEAREAARRHASRALHVYPDSDGTVRVRGRLTPEVGALLVQALAAARESLYQQRHDQAAEADPPTMEQQQADALALLAETALHHGIDPGAPGERYQVVVHVDAEVLADPDAPGQSTLEDGARVPAGTSQRLALHHRDRGCRFPGCGVRFGQGHHIRHWAHGGPTTLANLALLCRRHHRAVHEEGFQLDRQADGALRFRRPDGRPLPEVPPPPKVSDDPVQVLRAQHDAAGLVLHANTATPGWLGERLDVGWAIDVLHPLAVGPSARA
jgi:hypothetical protein